MRNGIVCSPGLLMRTDKLSDFVSVLSNVVHSDEMFDILFDLTGSELYTIQKRKVLTLNVITSFEQVFYNCHATTVD